MDSGSFSFVEPINFLSVETKAGRKNHRLKRSNCECRCSWEMCVDASIAAILSDLLDGIVTLKEDTHICRHTLHQQGSHRVDKCFKWQLKKNHIGWVKMWNRRFVQSPPKCLFEYPAHQLTKILNGLFSTVDTWKKSKGFWQWPIWHQVIINNFFFYQDYVNIF